MPHRKSLCPSNRNRPGRGSRNPYKGKKEENKKKGGKGENKKVTRKKKERKGHFNDNDSVIPFIAVRNIANQEGKHVIKGEQGKENKR